ncbi:hypothetical protein B0H14DRAFT_2809919 [Mycena olivaceomarginata]|nr:hypothetical protein B0H14DRAFT_2809919 [Mycena olivaceomarginata]
MNRGVVQPDPERALLTKALIVHRQRSCGRSDIVPVVRIVPHRGCSQYPDGNVLGDLARVAPHDAVCHTSALSALRSTAGISGNTRLLTSSYPGAHEQLRNLCCCSVPPSLSAARLTGATALLTLECRSKFQHPTRATWRFTPRTSMRNPP